MIKGQVDANFVAKLTPKESEERGDNIRWILPMDGLSNLKGSGAIIILNGPDGLLFKQSLKLSFKVDNHQIEYEALIVGMLLAKELGVCRLLAKSDSLLITGHVYEEYQAKDPQLALYLKYFKSLIEIFSTLDLVQVLRDQNSQVNLLSKLASLEKEGAHHTIIKETLMVQRVITKEDSREDYAKVLQISIEDTWMAPYIRYTTDALLLSDLAQVMNFFRQVYRVISNNLSLRTDIKPTRNS